MRNQTKKASAGWIFLALAICLLINCDKKGILPPTDQQSSDHYLFTTRLGCRETAIGKAWENTEVDVNISIWQTDLNGENPQILKDTVLTRRKISSFPILPEALAFILNVPRIDTLTSQLHFGFSRVHYPLASGISSFSRSFLVELKPSLSYQFNID